MKELLFGTDLRLFNIIYSQCKQLGGIFSFGVFEGFVLYSSLILLIIFKVGEKRK